MGGASGVGMSYSKISPSTAMAPIRSPVSGVNPVSVKMSVRAGPRVMTFGPRYRL
jgi:hypothetical protein